MTLVVVSGAPGTGKSTIADALGAALRFPVLSLVDVDAGRSRLTGRRPGLGWSSCRWS
ncbi:MAG: AAA family ATPase [Streptosporangiaceae bacterium]